MDFTPHCCLRINNDALGIRVVPQSTEGLHEYFISRKDEHGQDLFQLAGGAHRPEDSPTDTVSLMEGYITITALAPGMTDLRKTKELQNKMAAYTVTPL